MTAAFPGQDSAATSYASITSTRQGHFVTIEGHIRGLVPSFYEPHPNEGNGIVVKRGGVPLLASTDGKPFTVEEVPVERRWAIGRDGELLDELDFQNRFKQIELEFYEVYKRENPTAEIQMGKPGLDIPNITNFVSRQEDPTNPVRLVPMHYDPMATQGAKPESLYDGDGNAVDRLDALRKAAADPKARKLMSASELAEIDAAGGASAPDTLADKLEALKAADLPAEQYRAAVAKLVGVDLGTESEKPEPPAATIMRTAQCGKPLGPYKSDRMADNAKRMHEARCNTCPSGGDPPEAA